jgi:hypothetical protein
MCIMDQGCQQHWLGLSKDLEHYTELETQADRSSASFTAYFTAYFTAATGHKLGNWQWVHIPTASHTACLYQVA